MHKDYKVVKARGNWDKSKFAYCELSGAKMQKPLDASEHFKNYQEMMRKYKESKNERDNTEQ